MYRNNWLFPATCLTLVFGCSFVQKSEPPPSPTSLSVEPKHAPTEKLTIQAVKSADGLIEGEIVGTPAATSKFAKLKIGMTLTQVESLIGQPNDTDSHITGRQFQPFHVGGDTLRIEAFYKNEGQLTFSNTQQEKAADTLIRIVVNPNITGKH